MSQRLAVRLATRDDLPTLVRFQFEMAAETEGLKLDLQTLERGVSAALGDPQRAQYWVASWDGELVGCLMTTPEWSDWRNGWMCWIQSVYVVPTARGRGVYRHLYETIRERVENDPEIHGIRLYVDRRNEGARRTYAALGMSPEHYEVFEWMAASPRSRAGGGSDGVSSGGAKSKGDGQSSGPQLLD